MALARASHLRRLLFAGPARSFHAQPHQAKAGVVEFLNGVGKDAVGGDLQRLLEARTLRLKKLGIPCKHGLRHYASLSSPGRSISEVDEAVGNLERSSELDALKAKRTRTTISKKSGEAMMFPLQFHYEDVLRQDLLLKLNHANVMEVPGLFEIRLVPKAASDFRTQIGKLAMEIFCGQRFIQTQTDPFLKARKSFRSNPFLGSGKDTGNVSDFTGQSVLRGHGMYHFLVRILTVMSMLDSPVKIQENSIKFCMETEFCEFSPELEDHFEIFEHIRGFNVTVVTSANTKDETLLLWSGFLVKDEGEN